MKLDFAIVGAPKAGTTAVYQYLRSARGYYLPSKKELNYYTYDASLTKSRHIDFTKSRSEYESYFQEADDRLCGDVSPSYAACPGALDRLTNDWPEIRLVYLLRDPLDRSFSEYLHNQADGTESRSFEGALRDERSANDLERRFGRMHVYIDHSRYDRHLAELTRLGCGESCLLVASHSLRENTLGTMRAIAAHIGVPFDGSSSDLLPVNEMKIARSTAHRAILGSPAVRRVSRLMLPRGLRARTKERLFQKPLSVRPDIPEAARATFDHSLGDGPSKIHDYVRTSGPLRLSDFPRHLY